MRNFYSQDGEAEILTPAMCDIVQAAFAAAFIDFAKGPPSATGIHQSWDRNTCFRDTKTGMRTVTEAGTDTSNPTLALHFRRAIAELKLKFPQVNIPSAVETKMIKAIETLTYVQKNGYVQARKHVTGYEGNEKISV
jgi:hypothetical protein